MKPVYWLKNHIAIVLVGIFIFPVVFQPVHVIWHQSPGSCIEHQCCKVEATESTSLPGMKFESQDDEHCPICEYQFPVKDLPEAFLFRPFTPLIHCSLEALVIDLAFPQPKSTKTPRAPPAFIS